MFRKEIGEKIKSLREEAKLTTTELSTMAGLSQGTISLIENGKRNASPTTLKKIIDVLSQVLKRKDLYLLFESVLNTTSSEISADNRLFSFNLKNIKLNIILHTELNQEIDNEELMQRS